MLYARYLSIFLLLIIFSCQSKKKDWVSENEELLNEIIDSEVIIPSSLKKAKIASFSNTKGEKRFKIISYIDGTCVTCINNLLYWKEFNKNVILTDNDIELVLIVFTNDEDYFEKEYLIKYGLDLPIYYDRTNDFIVKNKLFDHRIQTLLLGSSNECLVLGNPAISKKIEKLYLNRIFNNR
ncbi:hypothetical protein GVN16_14600 [Emticicia sp. CRIBPO]|uniref:hypothetical protein n=1 Tax=Emticicia sp. CRIBPO TaxID=2683258 RepID=UPI00141336FA|nr:hypothetical protein [Emticicia sp. CRIBPO]NBA86999.1 hypothetical protein [Emticicia sp. CRIBPO]